MNREQLMDELQSIQDRNYNKFKGSNEADLFIREEIADLFEKHKLKTQSINFQIPAAKYPLLAEWIEKQNTIWKNHGTATMKVINEGYVGTEKQIKIMHVSIELDSSDMGLLLFHLGRKYEELVP